MISVMGFNSRGKGKSAEEDNFPKVICLGASETHLQLSLKDYPFSVELLNIC